MDLDSLAAPRGAGSNERNRNHSPLSCPSSRSDLAGVQEAEEEEEEEAVEVTVAVPASSSSSSSTCPPATSSSAATVASSSRGMAEDETPAHPLSPVLESPLSPGQPILLLPAASAVSATVQNPAEDEPASTYPRNARYVTDRDGKRVSFSSLYSMNSSLYSSTGEKSASTVSSGVDGSTTKPAIADAAEKTSDMSLPSSKPDSPSVVSFDPAAIAFTPPTTTASARIPQGLNRTNSKSDVNSEARSSGWISRPGRSSSRTPRRFSGSTAASSASEVDAIKPTIGKIGVCALDVKARSKPSQSILTRLQSKGDFEVILFGDKVILDEDVENWPECDFLIAFFSDGFPLDKAIAYAKLRKPFCINDLPMQQVLWDRRLCLRILDQMSIPTPKRIEVNRDGGPTIATPELAQHVYNLTGVALEGPPDGTGGGTPRTQSVTMSEDGEALIVDGKVFRKPFVEKPVNGEDHNIHIYFPNDQQYGGGGRKLFRKIGNKSSEYDRNLKIPRSITEPGVSYLYEQFLRVDNAEDVKAYTVGPDYCHAETRKSPVVDGVVRRNTHGKELRYITKLGKEEASMATKISNGFGQRICGFDLLRVGDKSYVIDVNGWSFVKDNNDYYDKSAKILNDMFLREMHRREGKLDLPEAPAAEPPTTRKNSSGQHRHALKTLLKSPSMSRIHAGFSTHKAQIAVPPTANSPSSKPDLTQPKHTSRKEGVSKDDALTLERPKAASPQTTNGAAAPPPLSKHSWKLKGMVAVIRHADRTPKQKFKFTFHTQPFIDLLKGHQQEVVIKGPTALHSVSDAVEIALREGIEDSEKLRLLKVSLDQKASWPGTKVQIKPMFRHRTPAESRKGDPENSAPISSPIKEPTEKSSQELDGEGPRMARSDSVSGPTFSRFSAVENDLILDKLQLVIKWGGEPTHAARYQAQDVGLMMRDDLKLMNKEALNDVRMFTSSERRVSTSAQIFASTFLDQKEIPENFIKVRKDLLDDSNAAKDVMDKVKKKLKLLLREGNSAPPQFAWPKENFPKPSVVLSTVVDLLKFHRAVMHKNLKKMEEKSTTANGSTYLASAPFSEIQGRWCAGEDHVLFIERWEKLFKEFCDSEKVDPSKLSELYDSMKFDALHNRQFLEWVFLPPDDFIHESEGNTATPNFPTSENEESNKPTENNTSVEHSDPGLGLMQPLEDSYETYFKLYPGSTHSKTKTDKRLSRLRQLYNLAKVLFDFVTPQEYGIKDEEKLEIGLLTSLPLLQEIVMDLEEVQASPDAKSFFYFTKESHIYTLLNCILEGGIQTKIARRAIPELDYLSQICFELYEAWDSEAATFSYSIRISISPGCHTFDPLDVQLDSRHAIGCAPRRSLTAHQDWKQVIETLKAKFDTVKLPKSFIAINLSDKHAAAREGGE
ncbi:hypothetical protein FQN57_007340 [Myotisia sp. PD_48]|nr:hypothetical protein FQN57_007340 [Myotisia sp. PD_48]